MLSRIAESLFWIGRYVERAEDTARLIDVNLQLRVEDPTTDPTASARSLLSVMGVQTDEHTSPADVLPMLMHNPAAPTSIVSAIAGARESARR